MTEMVEAASVFTRFFQEPSGFSRPVVDELAPKAKNASALSPRYPSPSRDGKH
jgi:hypothetical protein